MSRMRRELLLYRSGPAGFRLLADFILELEDGKIARTETTQRLAAAFEKIINDEQDAEHALGLARKRGERRPRSASEQAAKYGHIWKFISDEMAAAATLDTANDRFVVRTRRGTLSAAIAQAAKRYRRGERWVERIWKQYAPIHRFTVENRFWSEFVRQYFTEAEFQQVAQADGATILRMAFDRRRNPQLSLEDLCKLEKRRRNRVISKP